MWPWILATSEVRSLITNERGWIRCYLNLGLNRHWADRVVDTIGNSVECKVQQVDLKDTLTLCISYVVPTLPLPQTPRILHSVNRMSRQEEASPAGVSISPVPAVLSLRVTPTFVSPFSEPWTDLVAPLASHSAPGFLNHIIHHWVL